MTKRVKRRLYPPMIVASTVNPTYMTKLYLAISAFEEGMAEKDDFSGFLDCIELLVIGTSNKGETETLELVKFLRIAIENIRMHYTHHGTFHAGEEEIKALKTIVKVSEDFWKRQSGEYYQRCVEALKMFREQQKEKTS